MMYLQSMISVGCKILYVVLAKVNFLTKVWRIFNFVNIHFWALYNIWIFQYFWKGFLLFGDFWDNGFKNYNPLSGAGLNVILSRQWL